MPEPEVEQEPLSNLACWMDFLEFGAGTTCGAIQLDHALAAGGANRTWANATAYTVKGVPGMRRKRGARHSTPTVWPPLRPSDLRGKTMSSVHCTSVQVYLYSWIGGTDKEAEGVWR